jgi:hypothetical protein
MLALQAVFLPVLLLHMLGKPKIHAEEFCFIRPESVHVGVKLTLKHLRIRIQLSQSSSALPTSESKSSSSDVSAQQKRSLFHVCHSLL